MARAKVKSEFVVLAQGKDKQRPYTMHFFARGLPNAAMGRKCIEQDGEAGIVYHVAILRGEAVNRHVDTIEKVTLVPVARIPEGGQVASDAPEDE